MIFISYACHFSIILYLVPIFLLYLLALQMLTPPLYIGQLFPTVFVVVLFTYFL